jgi:hypothetical protein
MDLNSLSMPWLNLHLLQQDTPNLLAFESEPNRATLILSQLLLPGTFSLLTPKTKETARNFVIIMHYYGYRSVGMSIYQRRLTWLNVCSEEVNKTMKIPFEYGELRAKNSFTAYSVISSLVNFKGGRSACDVIFTIRNFNGFIQTQHALSQKCSSLLQFWNCQVQLM